MDIILLLLAIALLVTLGAFFMGWTPYPFGWILLSIFMTARIIYLANRRK